MIRPIIYTLVGIPLLVYACYFVALGMFSFKKKGRIPYAPAQKRLAVVLPARNEEAVIGQLVETLRAQNYPSELFDVFVAPNHCTDRTAEIAASRGAKVLSISDAVKNKGDVLREVFSQLTQDDSYDAFVVFDSDNLACPDFLQRMNDAMCAGYEVVQGNRDSKNPGDTWISGDTSIYYWLLNTFVHKARMNIDSSAVLNGTGLLISRRALQIVGYDVKSLTEDIEFSTMCAIKGVRIAYAEEAVFYDEQPLGLWDSLKQRKRWSVGCYECLRFYWKGLVSGIVRRPKPRLLRHADDDQRPLYAGAAHGGFRSHGHRHRGGSVPGRGFRRVPGRLQPHFRAAVLSFAGVHGNLGDCAQQEERAHVPARGGHVSDLHHDLDSRQPRYAAASEG